MRTRTTLIAAAVLLGAVFCGTGVATAAATGHDPVGHFDKALYDPHDNSLTVGGWAADPDLGAAAGQRVMISIDGDDVQSIATSTSRPDVARVYPRYGSKTGFSRKIVVPKDRGAHTVCARAINRGAGAKVSVLLSCKKFTVRVAGAIIGHIDKAVVELNGDIIVINGWVLNPYDAVSPTAFTLTHPGEKDFYVQNAPEMYFQTYLARPDVDRQYPRNGTKHGFSAQIETRYEFGEGAGGTICLARVPGLQTGTGTQPGDIFPYGPAEPTRFCAVIQPEVPDE